MKINVFDFDGTLIQGDSTKHFAKWLYNSHCHFFFKYYFSFVLIFFLKRSELKQMRANKLYNDFQSSNKDISDFHEILYKKLYDDCLELLKTKEQNIIISAGYDFILSDFCLEYLRTEIITNSLNSTVDINYEEKVNQFHSKYGTEAKIISGYGNSLGDKAILKNSKNSYVRTKSGVIKKINPNTYRF